MHMQNGAVYAVQCIRSHILYVLKISAPYRRRREIPRSLAQLITFFDKLLIHSMIDGKFQPSGPRRDAGQL